MARQTHIVRLIGTNKAGDALPDIWVDVERIHSIPKQIDNTQAYPNSSQEVTQYLTWRDDPDWNDYEPENQVETAGGRTNVILKVCSPDESNLDDPEEWIPVKIISQLKMRNSDWVQRHTFRIAESRPKDARRIVHYDTNIDNDAQAAFAAGKKAYVIASVDYTVNRDTKDEGQYIEQQIVNTYNARISELGSQDQDISIYFDKRHPLIDDAPDAKLEQIGPEGINPPYRLDPFQNIINVQFRSLNDIMFIWASGYTYGGGTSGLPDNRAHFYISVTGDQGDASFPKDSPYPVGFTPGTVTSEPTDEQITAAIEIDGVGVIKMDGSLAFVFQHPTIYAIEPDGSIIQSVDISSYLDQVPPGFSATGNDGEPDEAPNPPSGGVEDWQVANNVAVLAFVIIGVSNVGPGMHPGPPPVSAGERAPMSAVGYVAVGKDGVIDSALISGPNEGTGFTDAGDNAGAEYAFEEADFVGVTRLYIIAKRNTDPTS